MPLNYRHRWVSLDTQIRKPYCTKRTPLGLTCLLFDPTWAQHLGWNSPSALLSYQSCPPCFIFTQRGGKEGATPIFLFIFSFRWGYFKLKQLPDLQCSQMVPRGPFLWPGASQTAWPWAAAPCSQLNPTQPAPPAAPPAQQPAERRSLWLLPRVLCCLILQELRERKGEMEGWRRQAHEAPAKFYVSGRTAKECLQFGSGQMFWTHCGWTGPESRQTHSHYP